MCLYRFLGVEWFVVSTDPTVPVLKTLVRCSDRSSVVVPVALVVSDVGFSPGGSLIIHILQLLVESGSLH